MRKLLKTYTLVFVIPAIFLVLSEGCLPRKASPKIDWNVSLKRDGRNPYDLYLTYTSLSHYFPYAQIKPKYSDYDFTKVTDWYKDGAHSLFVVVANNLSLSSEESSALLDYVASGNYVCLSGVSIDPELLAHFSLEQKSMDIFTPLYFEGLGQDTLQEIYLNATPAEPLSYKGRNIKAYFNFTDSGETAMRNGVLQTPATDYKNNMLSFVRQTTVPYESTSYPLAPGIISYAYGSGKFIFVASPLVLSNYFLLQAHNRRLLDALWGELPAEEISEVHWAAFMYRTPARSTFSILWENPATRMALIIALIAVALFLIFETKRKQRIIPIIIPADNSTMAFIETVGMLYFNKSDNNNLATKMEQHFLDWVRTHYYLNTQVLDRAFVEHLTLKSGMPYHEVEYLVDMIHRSRIGEISFTDELLLDYYKRMRNFYRQK